jgi:hypothetical protein
MKKILLLLAVVSISCVHVCLGRQHFLVFDQFAERYAPSDDIITLLEKYKERILQLPGRGVLKEIPNFFIKITDLAKGPSRLIHRVINAERMRRCIRKHNLNCLDVVKKHIYKLDGIWISGEKCAVRLDGKWIVLAEKINFKSQQLELSLQEVQQLTLLAEKTLYRDWGFARAVQGGRKYGGNNWVRDARTGRLVCIDTEDRSFEAGEGNDLSGRPYSVVLKYLYDGIADNCSSRFKARRWLRKRKREQADRAMGLSLNRSREYDDPDLNFEEVKKQWILECTEFDAEQAQARAAGC